MRLVSKIKTLLHFLLAVSAYWYHGRPARQLIVVGVTGTKGKSTTCRLIASILEAGGHKVGMLTTVEFQIADKRWMNDKKMTMLGRGEIQKMLQDMVQAGCTYAVIETSSEGIMQYRHYGLQYDVAVFTNLGTEHSERHGGFDNLKQDKGKMFAALRQYRNKIINGKKVEKVIVANIDDDNADYFLSFGADRKYGFALKKEITSIRGKEARKIEIPSTIAVEASGSTFTLQDSSFEIKLPGEFNVYNALAAVVVGRSQDIHDGAIALGLKSVKEVPGRMQFIHCGQPFKVIVDYAHEPLSLTALFTTLRQMVAKNNGRVIAVIGSDGGGRDIKKRGKMGAIAGELCDYVVVSDVNCFDEDPNVIAEMLAAGARTKGKKDNIDLFIVVDRRQGFAKALSLAKAGDVVVVTAKGTEPVMCVAGGQRIPWDDASVLRELLSVNHKTN